jgi:hypothetical protein
MVVDDRGIGAVLFTPPCLATGRLAIGLQHLVAAGFIVTSLDRLRLDEEAVRRVWEAQAGEFTAERWDVAVELFTAGPSALAIVVGDAVEASHPVADQLKVLQGPSDPDLLERHHLRARLQAANKVNNLVHVPADPAAVVREVAIMAPPRASANLWREASEARPLRDLGSLADAFATSGSVCVVRNALRLRRRALRQAEIAAGEPPEALREELRAGSRWVAALAGLEGAGALRRWRRECFEDRFGDSLAAWLDPEEPVCRAMRAVDKVLRGEPIRVSLLEAELAACGVDPDRWEFLSLATEVVSEEARRCA